MTGPELDHELEAIGRRLSPRLGRAHDAVVTRAAPPRGARARRPRPAPPRLRSLGGAALTVAITAGFAALLAVGVATRPAATAPSAPTANGPAVAMATTPGLPAVTNAAGGGPATPPPAMVVAPAPALIPTTPAPSATAGSAPTTPAGAPTTAVQPTGPAPRPTAPASQPPWEAAGPTEAPAPTEGPWPRSAPTAPARTGPSPTPAAPVRVLLTEQDSGRTITVHRGDIVEVRLSGGGPMAWTVPSSSDRTIVAQTGGGQTAQGGATGSFRAARAGTADLSATENPNCRPQCMMPSRLWVVHVVVAG